jgi:hypothetical protein
MADLAAAPNNVGAGLGMLGLKSAMEVSRQNVQKP